MPNYFPGFTGDDQSPAIFLTRGDNMVHNWMNYGNYLWAATGYMFHIPLGILKLGAHANSLDLLNLIKNLSTSEGARGTGNGYPPQFDSIDDQRSILKGYQHARKKQYKRHY